MHISTIVPHFKVGKITAFTIYQLLKFKGNHHLDIVVIDNHPQDDSKKYLEPFKDKIVYKEYPTNLLQSHGIAYDFAIENRLVKSDYFICLENDAYPTKENFIDYYQELVNRGYDMAGSIMDLSGGQFIHPTGCLYSKKLWQEAKDYCSKIEYSYFPNISTKENFDGHLMVHQRVADKFLSNPEDYIELSLAYKPYSKRLAEEKRSYYLPTTAPFHNGMGMRQESVKTYGRRTMETESRTILLDNKVPVIFRVGYEPGQWLTYFALNTNKNVGAIPTEIKWMDGRINQQQEFTINEAGIRHEWGIAAHYKSGQKDIDDIVQFKNKRVDELYNSLPNEYKI